MLSQRAGKPMATLMMVPGVADELSGQQFPDHVHRFLEHLHALFRRRLVEPWMEMI
jgi:hypothetical protein